MSDRVIRDEILRSERYWSVSIEAQRLFIHLLLNVDDTARFSGKNFTLRSACYPGHQIDPEKLERLLTELVDVDLVRLYEQKGERFVFVPRFKQRLRFTKSRFPDPPKGISDIPIKKTGSRRTRDGPKSDAGQSQDGRSEEKRREEKRSKTSSRQKAAGSTLWDLAIPALRDQGIEEKTARAFLGSLLKSWDETALEDAFRASIGKADIRAYVSAILKSVPKKGERKVAI